MRRDELMHLEWSDIDLKNSRLFIRPKADWHPKDYEFRTIPLGAQIKETLMSVMGEGLVFTRYKEPRSLSRRFTQALRAANIQNACLHTLRHTYASHLVMSGVDLATVQKLLGHADIKTTMRYAHLAPGHLEIAAKKLDKSFGQFSIGGGLADVIDLGVG
jgi:integrase